MDEANSPDILERRVAVALTCALQARASSRASDYPNARSCSRQSLSYHLGSGNLPQLAPAELRSAGQ